MPVKVSTNNSVAYSDLAKGMTWAVDHGARVLNVSIAGSSSSSLLSSAVDYAASHGVLVVAAAGNGGSSAPMYPAAIPGVVSVAASDQNDALTSYSEYGSWVDLAAPGQTVSTLLDGTYNAVGGTSIASPAVAGIAGLLFSAQPAATPADVANALVTTTDPTTGTRATAHGRVDAYGAVTALTGGASDPAPAAPSPLAVPTISGTAQSGQTLTASTGSWSGSPTSYGYQWQRCDSAGANCADVPGATASTYALAAADVGCTVRVAVVATNAGGSASATSAPTAVVAAGSATYTFSGTLTKSVHSRSYATTVGDGPGTGSLSFGRCTSLSLTLTSAAGAVLAQASGPSVLTVSAGLAAGSYAWTVSGSCRVSFTLTVTAAA
jgi:hypothetical protein